MDSDNTATEDERNDIALRGLRRLEEILSEHGDLPPGDPLPQDSQKEVDQIFADAKAAGVLLEGFPPLPA